MPTVLSHIIQKRYSQEYENIATEALAFILDSYEPARERFVAELRSMAKDLAALRFQTQQTFGSIRPDMVGYGGKNTHAFVEAKFWAGLTENQPVAYLEDLSTHGQPAILLFIVPETRQEAVWREMIRRLESEGITTSNVQTGASIITRSVLTGLGPILGISSWVGVLKTLEDGVRGDSAAQSDLYQLRALCDAADSEAFSPLSANDLGDQRIPRLLLDLNAAWKAAVDKAVSDGILNVGGLNPQASEERAGRYARFGGEKGPGVWIGVHLRLWRQFGGTPMWLVFATTSFGQRRAVQSLLDPWAVEHNVKAVTEGSEYVVALDLATGEEKDAVVNAIVDRLRDIGQVLEPLA